MAPLEVLDHDDAPNAIVGWLLTGVLALAVVESLVTNAFLWAGFAFVLLVVAVLPSVLTGRWTLMVPWPLLLIGTVAVLLRSFDAYPEVAGYLGIATLALLVVVELDAFTTVEMSRRFAVAFAVLTTVAIQGLWTIAQFYSDLWVGTEFLHSQRELQVDIVTVTAIAIAMGVVFGWYFGQVPHDGSNPRTGGSSQG